MLDPIIISVHIWTITIPVELLYILKSISDHHFPVVTRQGSYPGLDQANEGYMERWLDV